MLYWWLWEQRKDTGAKERKWSLEAGKGKVMNSSLESPEGM